MKKSLVGVMAAAAIASADVEAAPRYCEVSVIQWNLHIAIDMTGRYNLKAQADVLNKINADVTALNEVDKNCSRTGYVDMTKELGILTGSMFTQFCAARAMPPEGLYGNAMLSRYRMELVGSWLIPATRDETRGMMLMKIYAPNPFLVALTHLNFRQTPEEDQIRVEAVKFIDKMISKNNTENLPVILIGDFNAKPGTNPVKALEDAGWKLEKTLPTYPSRKPVSSIDHIFVKDARIEIVERIPVDEKIASDHIPVINKIKIYRNIEHK